MLRSGAHVVSRQIVWNKIHAGTSHARPEILITSARRDQQRVCRKTNNCGATDNFTPQIHIPYTQHMHTYTQTHRTHTHIQNTYVTHRHSLFSRPPLPARPAWSSSCSCTSVGGAAPGTPCVAMLQDGRSRGPCGGGGGCCGARGRNLGCGTSTAG